MDSEKEIENSSEVNQSMSTMSSEMKMDDDIKTTQDGEQKGKRKTKASKKGAKLDTKSKLEKSRQSARECRARKKLRYQYLEDLVNSREKAVVKLRDELTMFSDLSKVADMGALRDAAKSDYSSSCAGVTSVGIFDDSREPS